MATNGTKLQSGQQQNEEKGGLSGIDHVQGAGTIKKIQYFG